MEFKFIELNYTRMMRGAAAARVICISDGDEDSLWMSPVDVAHNIAEYGPHPERLKAQQAYRNIGS